MQSLRRFITALALASLAACSAAPLDIAHGGIPSISSRDTKKPIVYVSQQGENRISLFKLDGRRIGTITDEVNYPQGIFADAAGTLYVANRGSYDVLEFRAGAASPFKVLSDGGNQPEDVTVCPDHTVYVANIQNASGGGGNIAVYAHGSRKPTGMLTYDEGNFFFLTCDAHGNLFATLVLGTTGTVAAFPKGKQGGARRLPIFFGGNPAGITADPSGNILVAGQGDGVEEFTESGQPTGLQIATKMGLIEIALSSDGKLLVGASAQGAAQYTFPGGAIDHIYHAGGTPIGAAFDPGTN